MAWNLFQDGWERWRTRWLSPQLSLIDPLFLYLWGYGPLIRTYVQFLLQKLRFHRLRPEFNGLFDYDEYVTLKGIDDPNEGWVPHFERSVPSIVYNVIDTRLFRTSWIYKIRLSHSKRWCSPISDILLTMNVVFLPSFHSWRKAGAFIDSSLVWCERCTAVRVSKYMFWFTISPQCSGTNDVDVLEPLKERYSGQHYSLRKFYYECSNLKYLTGLINVPKLGHVGTYDDNLSLNTHVAVGTT